MEKIILFFKKLYIGRLGRVQYLIGFIIGVISIFIGSLFVIAFNHPLESLVSIEWYNPAKLFFYSLFIFGLLFIFISIFIAWSLNVRRWHDIGYSGWMVLSGLIPVINILVIIILFFVPSEKESNRYGQRNKSFNIKNILFNRNTLEIKSHDKYIEIFLFNVAILSVVYAYLKLN